MMLSPEILEKIFSHLDITSLKSCLLVSKYFRESILNSPIIMRKLPLKLNSGNWQSKLDFVKHLGIKMKRVEIVSKDKNCEFVRMLHFTPMASVVAIDWSSRDEVVQSMYCKVLTETMEIKFEKLVNLKISLFNVNAELLFRQMLNSSNVKKLCIRCDEESTSLVAFLAKQSKLEELELKFGQYDDIFSEENIRKFNFKHFNFEHFEHFNTFLIMQSRSLIALHIYLHLCESKIARSIRSLENLERLTTHTILPCFQFHGESGIAMKSLTHYRYYGGNINQTIQSISPFAFPKLESLNVHFGLRHIIGPDILVTINPLNNFQNLREFQIESRSQDVLDHVASPMLEVLGASYEQKLFDQIQWKRIVKNLPKLSTLIIGNIRWPFLKVICDIEKSLKKTNLNLLILRSYFVDKNVLKCWIRNGKITKICGYYCKSWSSLIGEEEEFRKKFNNFDLLMISDEEYNRKFEFWNCYFNAYGLFNVL